MLAASVIAASERGRQLQRAYRRARKGAYLAAATLSVAAAVAIWVEVRGTPLPIAATAIIAAMLAACILAILLMMSSAGAVKAVLERADVNRLETCGAIQAIERRLVALDESHRSELGEMERRHQAAMFAAEQRHLDAIERLLADRGEAEKRAREQGRAEAAAAVQVQRLAELDQARSQGRADILRRMGADQFTGGLDREVIQSARVIARKLLDTDQE